MAETLIKTPSEFPRKWALNLLLYEKRHEINYAHNGGKHPPRLLLVGVDDQIEMQFFPAVGRYMITSHGPEHFDFHAVENPYNWFYSPDKPMLYMLEKSMGDLLDANDGLKAIRHMLPALHKEAQGHPERFATLALKLIIERFKAPLEVWRTVQGGLPPEVDLRENAFGWLPENYQPTHHHHIRLQLWVDQTNGFGGYRIVSHRMGEFCTAGVTKPYKWFAPPHPNIVQSII